MPTPLLSRDLFDMPAELLWLAHCKDGPMLRAAARSMQALLGSELRPWELRWQEDFLDMQQALRDAGAALLGARAEDISPVTCTTTGIQAVSQGYPWQAGDHVVIPALEFSSNRLPWLALATRGVTCEEIELWPGHAAGVVPDADIDPEQCLIEAITPATRIVAVSWVRYQDGIRLDLARLGRACRERGVHLVVDGIQGAGTHVPSLEYVSAFATGGHKGLLGPQGQGLLWTDPTLRAQLTPLGTWLSAPEAFVQSGSQATTDALWASDGRRLEAGSPSILSCGALAASIRTLLDAGGPQAFQAHIASLQLALLDRLIGSSSWRQEALRLKALLRAGRIGPTLCFRMPYEQGIPLLRTGEAQGVCASMREHYLRIALHGWHGNEDVERCTQWMLSA